ncbi:MAG: ABC transporter permease subunit, partial [Devosiaceae bacterium]|nr:ABC transporter permease subunit [Devosiaceae bacterium]
MKKTATLWQIIALIGALFLPWYGVNGGFWSFGWIGGVFSDPKSASAVAQGLIHDRWWLITALVPLAGSGLALLLVKNHKLLAKLLVLISIAGLVMIAAQGFIVGRTGPRIFADLFMDGPGQTGQSGLGSGAMIVFFSQLFILTTGVSGIGKGRGDAFIVGLIGLIISLVGIFVFFPVSHILVQAFQNADGAFSFAEFWERLSSSRIWSLRCLTGSGSCGPAWNSLVLAILTGAGTTLLGLAFALIATRTNFKAKPLLRVLTIIPIITPPFVIGLALILLFGRSGTVTDLLNTYFDIPKTRWLYGFWGIYLAQLLSFTPIAFLVLIGVVEGVSPSMEEASQSLNANRWQTFRLVSFPLMRPGLANAFLLGFIESIAVFGNPLVLGG